MEKLLKNLMKKLKLPKVNKKGDVMSCVLCMLLVVLASQSRVFDFFIESNLGRMGLLALVFTICCTSKVFGAASVLFLVLAFAVHMNSREGMCGGKKKEGMCGGKKKEGMCGGKKKEAFGNLMGGDRLTQERDLQKGQQPFKEFEKKSESSGAKPHETLESEFGGAY
jgi:hypothetical protein|uniref:Uncharacterized protein n=1 Tax=viral metagenome TaxID=1070528 RepID=A0A6C0IKQ1_9ZZZZ